MNLPECFGCGEQHEGPCTDSILEKIMFVLIPVAVVTGILVLAIGSVVGR